MNLPPTPTVRPYSDDVLRTNATEKVREHEIQRRLPNWGARQPSCAGSGIGRTNSTQIPCCSFQMSGKETLLQAEMLLAVLMTTAIHCPTLIYTTPLPLRSGKIMAVRGRASVFSSRKMSEYSLLQRGGS